MNTVRKLFGLLFLMALALPASAQKVYTLGVTAVDSTTVAITVTNVSPPTQSNSTLNSFRIRSVFTLTGGSAASPSQPATVTLNSPPTSLSVKDFNGIKAAPLTPNSITINVKLASPVCGTSTWYIDGYTGNSLNGPINFSQVNASGAPQSGTQLAGPPCGLTIAVPPTTYVNTAFQVSVGYTGQGPAPASITLSWSCPAATSQTNTSPTNPTLFSVTLTNTGTCAFTASAPNYVSATASTTVYTANQPCGGTNNFGNLPVNTEPPPAYIGPPDWGLQSSVTNKDGTACTGGVPFTFNFEPYAAPQTASFNIAPATTGKSIKAQYVVLWNPVPVVTTVTDPDAGWSTGPYTPRPKLGWVKDVSDSSKYKLVPALWCKDDGLGNASDVLPTIPAVEPFVSLAAAYPGYAPGATAQMCVAQAGSTSVGLSFIQFWHKITDYVDGAVSWGQD